MRLTVDWEKCQGHGKCYLVAPELFAPDEDDDWGRAAVLVPEIAPEQAEHLTAAREALSVCPEFAIELENRITTG